MVDCGTLTLQQVDPGDVSIAACGFTPEDAYPGGEVQFSATVDNANASDTSVDVVWRVDGVDVSSASGTVPANGQETFVATAAYSTLEGAAGGGSHNVTVHVVGVDQPSQQMRHW